nr:MAG TPA: hypothetical protein [Caudoviricetes sp.]
MKRTASCPKWSFSFLSFSLNHLPSYLLQLTFREFFD